MHIASENHVTVDWIIMRALKLYLEEYRKTGRL
jgi:3-polyprenyl-4-hydroxybenzoate decarboxylase